MKRTILLSALLIISNFSFAQTIRRVTNLPGAATGVNTYATVNEAMAAATSGDIIYIEPSATPYAGFNVTKTLHFIGNGNFLEQNSNTPYEKSNSYIEGRVYFDANSNSSTASGLYFGAQVDIMNTIGVEIKKCRLAKGIFLNANTSGTLISENLIVNDVAGKTDNSSAQSTTLKNNIIESGNVSYLKNSTIKNNTIYYYYSSTLINNQGCTITNNILDRRVINSVYDVSGNNTGSTVTNNLQVLSASAVLPSANPDSNKNLYTGNFNNIYVVNNPWVSNDLIKDADFKLVAGSSAIGMGTFNTDAGAYGGDTPYTLSGLPNIPIITSAVSSTTGTNSVPLNVIISVRSN